MTKYHDIATASGQRRVAVSFVYPPVPVRCLDYQAYFDDLDDEGPIGASAAAEEAINDLLITAGEEIEP